MQAERKYKHEGYAKVPDEVKEYRNSMGPWKQQEYRNMRVRELQDKFHDVLGPTYIDLLPRGTEIEAQRDRINGIHNYLFKNSNPTTANYFLLGDTNSAVGIFVPIPQEGDLTKKSDKYLVSLALGDQKHIFVTQPNEDKKARGDTATFLAPNVTSRRSLSGAPLYEFETMLVNYDMDIVLSSKNMNHADELDSVLQRVIGGIEYRKYLEKEDTIFPAATSDASSLVPELEKFLALQVNDTGNDPRH